MGFKDILKKELSDRLSKEELLLLPRGFQTLGEVMILKLNQKLTEKKKLIGEICLKLYPHFKSVYLNLGKIVGTFRTPEKMELIAGEDHPIVNHKEHHVIYRFDLTKIMFSKGNLKERKFLATLVEDGEIIVDMFAGIGYFSLPIARHANPSQIFSIELNPEAYKFLLENIEINHLNKKIIPILGNCKEEVIKLSKKGIEVDRVIMGVLPAPKEYIKNALKIVKQKGTIFHYEGIVKKREHISLFQEFEEIAKDQGYYCELISKRIIKSFGPHLNHAVIDVLVSKR